MKSAKLKTTSVKVDPKKVAELQKNGIEFGELVRNAMDKALGVCPLCNHPLKQSKKR